ncbi:MAG: hypothetical protein H7125_17590 [Proteobacteria bacterium]|nr:hypothetical protein [Burkholderiales bacterium]
MTRGSTILFSEMTPQPAWDAEFNAWYDTEHIPLRMACPGFVSAQRYRATASASYLAVYEMGAPGDLQTPEYSKVKGEPSALTRRMLGGVAGFTRYICRETSAQQREDTAGDPLDAPLLYAVWFAVPAARRAAFDDWYRNEQLPTLLACPDWWLARRFEVVDGSPGRWTDLTLHYLGDRRALESPERASARSGAGRMRLAVEDWFRPEYVTFDRLGARQRARASVAS